MSETYKIGINRGTDWGTAWITKDKKYHRLDGPAIEMDSGSKEWWVTGKRHRVGGPAIYHSKNKWQWYCNGVLHREEGPALRDDKDYQWWFHGECYYGFAGNYFFKWGIRYYEKEEEWFRVIPKELQISYLFYGITFPKDE